MLPIVTAEQMRALDDETIHKLGVPGAVLMESAGRGVVELLWQLHARRKLDLHAAQVVIVAGPGNNGGDGLVVARCLHGRGVAVRLLLCAERERVRGDALLHLLAAEASGVGIKIHSGESGAAQVAAQLQQLDRGDVLVDALLGTGLQRAVSGPLRTVIEAANRSAALRIAVDLPSGLDADRGIPEGSGPEPVILRADHTVTFGFCKLGQVSAPGFTFGGRLHLVDIGIPEALNTRHGVRARLLDGTCLQRLGQARSPLAHKGSNGHLLIIAGSRGKIGAALLCARAALRTGVGLCTLAAPESAEPTIAPALSTSAPEAMSSFYPLPGPGGSAEALAQAWLAAGAGKHAVAIGPGLPTGSGDDTVRAALLALLASGSTPLVLDADALNQLVGEDEALRRAARARPIVLTPHPGEAARLLGQSVPEVQADRVQSARTLSQRTGAVVLLKGARTLVVAPDEPPVSAPPLATLSVVPTGNAGMGSGGMGDVLTGMIGALLAAGWPAHDAACAGAYWHGLAGDRVALRRAPGSVLLATELIDALDEARQLGLGTPPAAGWPLREVAAC
ncbi:MAG: NAD(P)H-hydrate dehydratase [Polyangia bacterium]